MDSPELAAAKQALADAERALETHPHAKVLRMAYDDALQRVKALEASPAPSRN